jgi:hypothetical protein
MYVCAGYLGPQRCWVPCCHHGALKCGLLLLLLLLRRVPQALLLLLLVYHA